MNVRWLEAFACVTRNGQINSAAEELCMSQSTLSRQLASLEKHVGTPLMTREARGVRLTPAGQIVQERAAQLLHQFDELAEVITAERLRSTHVRIGIPPGIPVPWLRTKLALLSDFAVILNEGTTNDQLALLDGGQLDFAITRERSSSHPSTLAFSQPLGVAMHPGARLRAWVTDEGELPINALDGARLMAHAQSAIRTSEGALRSLAEAAGASVEWVFRRFGLHGNIIAEAADVDGAMTIPSSQLLHSSDWTWFPLTAPQLVTDNLSIRTWINWRTDIAADLQPCVAALCSDRAEQHTCDPSQPEADPV